MNRNQLEAILNDPASTQTEKTAAEKALGQPGFEDVLHDDTRKMLDALKVRRITDLNEKLFENYCRVHSPRSTDPLVKEFRFWVPPDHSFLEITGMTLDDWWLAVHRIATVANRPDAAAHARRKMQGN